VRVSRGVAAATDELSVEWVRQSGIRPLLCFGRTGHADTPEDRGPKASDSHSPSPPISSVGDPLRQGAHPAAPWDSQADTSTALAYPPLLLPMLLPPPSHTFDITFGLPTARCSLAESGGHFGSVACVLSRLLLLPHSYQSHFPLMHQPLHSHSYHPPPK
jgi:hypothetical protein